MVTETFICDICKQSVGESELFKIDTTITVPKAPNHYSGKLVGCNKDICRCCLEKKGILTISEEGTPTQEFVDKNTKTLETKLVDFLVDLGVVFQD